MSTYNREEARQKLREVRLEREKKERIIKRNVFVGMVATSVLVSLIGMFIFVTTINGANEPEEAETTIEQSE